MKSNLFTWEALDLAANKTEAFINSFVPYALLKKDLFHRYKRCPSLGALTLMPA